MTPLLATLTAAAVVSLVLNLLGIYSRRRALVYLFKPLTTVLVLAIALLPSAADPRYRGAIVVGLVFSLAGDVFLMLRRDRFVPGLASFLLAHLAYLVAFTTAVRFAERPFFYAVYAAIGALILTRLWPFLGSLRVPVLAYVAVILAMAAQAAVRGSVLGTAAALLAAGGAALFVASDAILAFNRFRKPFRAAESLIMTTYVAAQLSIALSTQLTN